MERTRVVGLEHTKSNQRFKDHRRHRTNSKSHSEETKKTSAKPAELETKFKLWADGPNFDTNLRQNVVALVGRTAYLTCRVFDRGNKTVILAFTVTHTQCTEDCSGPENFKKSSPKKNS